MQAIYETPDPVKAQIAVDRLLAAGIEAQVIGEGRFSVVVADTDAERAVATLEGEAPVKSEATPAWDCPTCGERIEAGFDACWKCASAKRPVAVPKTPDVPAPAASDQPAEQTTDQAGRVAADRAWLWLELSTVLTLGWLVFFVGSCYSLAQGEPIEQSNWQSVFDATVALGNCLLVALVVFRADGDRGRFGIVRPGIADIGLAVVILVVGLGAEHGVSLMLNADALRASLNQWIEPIDSSALRDPFVFQSGAIDAVATAAFWFVMAAGEEFVFRAYLLPRLAESTGSPLAGTLISTALFASYHCYQGALNMVVIFAFGLAMAVGFWLTRRVWPLVLAHATMNMFF